MLRTVVVFKQYCKQKHYVFLSCLAEHSATYLDCVVFLNCAGCCHGVSYRYKIVSFILKRAFGRSITYRFIRLLYVMDLMQKDQNMSLLSSSQKQLVAKSHPSGCRVKKYKRNIRGNDN